jgi:hypothetical protein
MLAPKFDPFVAGDHENPVIINDHKDKRDYMQRHDLVEYDAGVDRGIRRRLQARAAGRSFEPPADGNHRSRRSGWGDRNRHDSNRGGEMNEKPVALIAPRTNEDGEEQRFREAIERYGEQLIQTLDAAIQLRQAHPDTQRARHLARGSLQGAMLRMLNAFFTHRALGPAQKLRSK